MRVVWSDRALTNLSAIGAYLTERNPRAATRIVDAIGGTVEGLMLHPQRGRPGRIPGTRELIVPRTKYLVAYRLRGDLIDILAVKHGAQRWPKRL